MGDNSINEHHLYYALPESYDPITSSLDFEQWVRKYKACAKANKWNEEDKLRHLPPLLKGDAWIIFDDLADNEKDTLEKLVDNLTKKLTVATQIQCGEQLHQRVLDYGNETLLTYQNDIRRLAHRAYPDMQEQQLKPVVLMAFIRGLRGHSIELARKVRNANPTTLEKALQKAQFIMSDPFIDDSERPEQDAMQHELTAIGNMERPAATYEQNGDDVEPTVSSSSSNVNPWLSPEWMERVVSAIAKTQRKCGYCGKEGHLESECFKKRRDRRGQALSTIPKGAEDPRLRREYPRTPGATCGYCLKRNHTEEQCQPKRRALERKGRPSPSATSMSSNEVNMVSLETCHGNTTRLPDSCTLSVALEACGSSIRTEALIDSGSTISIIDMDTLSSMSTSLTVDTEDTPVCKTAAGHSLKTLGSVSLNLSVLGAIFVAKFYITEVPLIHPVIIGRDIMAQGGFTLRFDNNKGRNSRVAAIISQEDHDDEDWRQLPSGWRLQEIVYSSNNLYIVTAISDNKANQKSRFYVGFNPLIISPASHSEQLRAQRPHKKLREASLEAKQAASVIFRQWITEGRAYGPSHCPRILELCLQWLVQHNFRPNAICEIQSYMDDLVIFSHKEDVDVERQLQELCGNYDLNLKPTKRQVITEGDTKLLGVMFIDGGRYLTIPPEKLDSFKLKVPREGYSYANLLGTLGSLDESPVVPAWALALKHYAQGLVAKERASRSLPWSAGSSEELRKLIARWHSMVSSMPPEDFVLQRLYDYEQPLQIFTDASKRAGGFIFYQDETILLQRVFIFAESETNLPIVCLEAHTLYRAFAAVHQIELAGHRRFPEVHYHVDNVAVEATFRVGRPATFSNKDAKPILAKYVAMVNALYDPLDFGRIIFVKRVSTTENPADCLTRHDLLTSFVQFANSKSIDLCNVSSSPTCSKIAHGYAPSQGVTIAALGVTIPSRKLHGLPTTHELCAGQGEDSQIQLVKQLLQRHEGAPADLDRGYVAVWSTLLVRNGLLMKHYAPEEGKSPTDVLVVPVLPSQLVPRVLDYFHDPTGAAHLGIVRVVKAIKRNYWFPHLAQRVCEHIGACPPCYRRQLKAIWRQDGVQRAAPPRPWHTVCADVVSISTPKARPLKSKSSKEIAQALREFNSRLGKFRILRTDGGLEFRGEVEAYLRSIDASHSVSLPFSPVAAIEQLNRTLINKFQAAVYTPAWSTLTLGGVLDDILWSIRSTPTSVHGIEPYTLLFGRHPHQDGLYSQGKQARLLEHVEDVLAERRSKACYHVLKCPN